MYQFSSDTNTLLIYCICLGIDLFRSLRFGMEGNIFGKDAKSSSKFGQLGKTSIDCNFYYKVVGLVDSFHNWYWLNSSKAYQVGTIQCSRKHMGCSYQPVYHRSNFPCRQFINMYLFRGYIFCQLHTQQGFLNKFGFLSYNTGSKDKLKHKYC